MHMPGHKGTALLGPEPLDLTEIEGADGTYHAEGIIRESEAPTPPRYSAPKRRSIPAEGLVPVHPRHAGILRCCMPAQITKSPSLRQAVTHTRSS